MARQAFPWGLAAALLVAAGPSHAAELSAEALYKDCAADKPTCQAYFAGFIGAAFTYEQMRQGLADVDPRFCPKRPIGVMETIGLFKERMAKYPEARQSPAISEVFRTLEYAFPCKLTPGAGTDHTP